MSWDEETASSELIDLWSGRSSMVWSMPDGSWQTERPFQPTGILSGSFNPLHAGHIVLQAAAEQRLQGTVCFELPILNADKPPLDFLSITGRCGQFADCGLLVTRAATFAEKADLLPNTTFVVGIDTAERIVQPRFYLDREDLMRLALERIRDAGCTFLVAGRKLETKFFSLGDIRLPAGFEALFDELPEREFRHDVTSTDLRQQHRR